MGSMRPSKADRSMRPSKEDRERSMRPSKADRSMRPSKADRSKRHATSKSKRSCSQKAPSYMSPDFRNRKRCDIEFPKPEPSQRRTPDYVDPIPKRGHFHGKIDQSKPAPSSRSRRFSQSDVYQPWISSSVRIPTKKLRKREVSCRGV